MSLSQLGVKTGAAATRLAWFRTPRGMRLAVLGSLFTAFMTFSIGAIGFSEAGQSIQYDFRVFWGAARLLLSGEPLAVFDQTLLAQAGNSDGFWMPWLYPPGFLILVTPLGLLPFGVAWIAFSAFSIGLLALSLRPFVSGVKPALVAFALAPAALPALVLGQNSVLWFAGLMFALAALRDGRHVRAGIIIGLLTLKPQLGLLVPAALIGMGAWRTIVAATLTTIALAAGPTLVFGMTYWSLLRDSIAAHAEVFSASIRTISILISPYSALVNSGVEEPTARLMQFGLAACLALAVLWVWSRKRLGPDIKSATLFAAISLASPYFSHYDAVSYALCALFLLRAGVLSTERLAPMVLFCLLWIGGGGAQVLQLLVQTDTVPIRATMLPVIVAAFTICLHAAMDRQPADRI